MNVILEGSSEVRYFTDIRLTLDALGLFASHYDWFVSDIETNYYGSDFKSEDRWMSGEELEKFISMNDVQFIWGVLTAVPKGYRVTVDVAPYIDGNPSYWSQQDISPQLRGALFEIACWDSSATILVNVPQEALERFTSRYPDTKPIRDCRSTE